MGAILPIIFSLLSSLPGMLGDYFKKKQEIEQQKLETERQVQVAQQQLAGEIARAQLELNKTIVSSTSSYFKYFTFIMWFGPFMIGTVSPSRANDIFLNWAGMPEWYVKSCMVLMFTVWGITVSAPAVSNIFDKLGDFLANRRDYKLEKARINRKAVADSLRTKWFPKGMNNQQVKDFDEAMNAGEQQE